jgi:predicted outer membrane repeat protein
VLLSRLTLTNGDAGFTSGGAILHAAGDLAVTGSRLIGNLALSGGAIAQQSPGRLLVLTSLLEGNTSSATGGAIHCDACGGIDIRLSVVNGNVAGSTGGAIHIEQSSLSVWLSGVSDNTAEFGGAIRALVAPVTILDSTLQRNVADVDGGALSTTSAVTIQRSTLAENSAGNNGGAAFVLGNAPVAVSNSTFSGNSALCGGGFSLLAGIGGGPVAILGTSTFFGNLSTIAGCGDHFQSTANSLALYNSIVEGGLGSNCNAAMSAGAHNLIDDATCNSGAASFNLGTVTLLDPVLAYHGGPTRTHLIDPASNAVDAGRNAACLNPSTGAPLVMDQRGQTRPVDFTGAGVATCDIGSVELQ